MLPRRAALFLLLLGSFPLATPKPAFSFHLHEPLGTLKPSQASCCEFGGQPLPLSDTRKKPALLGLGMHKSGTTYLFNVLKLHPNFTAPTAAKELMTFAQWPIGINAFDHYMDSWDVEDVPANEHLVLYEITATYLAVPGAACRIRNLLPDAKFVVVLRDPVERAESHYNFATTQYMDGKRHQAVEPFYTEVMREIDALTRNGCSFNSTALPTGQSRMPTWNDCLRCWYLISSWEAKKVLCSKFGLLGRNHAAEHRETPCQPHINLNMYMAFGIYAPQIAWWLGFYPPDRFLFLNQEDLRTDPVLVANRVALFMGQKAIFTPELLEAHKEEIDDNPGRKVVDKSTPEYSQGVEKLRSFLYEPVQQLYQLFDHIGVKDFKPFKNFPKEQRVFTT